MSSRINARISAYGTRVNRNVSFRPEDEAALKEFTATRDVSVSQVVRVAVREYISRHGNEEDSTLVDSGLMR